VIPLVANVSVRPEVRPWIPIPLFLIWLLLTPIVLLLLPVFFVACLVGRVNPWRALAAGWRILSAMPGTNVEVQQRKHYMLIELL
jgi:hypothetical protein